MKKTIFLVIIGIFCLSLFPISSDAKNVENDNLKYALIRSLSPSIDEALEAIYKNEPSGVPSWAGWDTEILSIKQLLGVGGEYEVIVRVHPFYGPHNGNGYSDVITIRLSASGQSLDNYKHIKDV